MSKVVESTSVELTLQVVNWEQYFNAIIRERVYSVVQEYTSQTSSYELSQCDPNTEVEVIDPTYTRMAVLVEDLVHPCSMVRKQLLQQLTEAKREFVDYGMDLQDSIEEVTFKAMEGFVDIESCVVVDMGRDADNQYGYYMLAPTSREDLVIKLMNYSQGAVVVYRPVMFTLFKVKEATPG